MLRAEFAGKKTEALDIMHADTAELTDEFHVVSLYSQK